MPISHFGINVEQFFPLWFLSNLYHAVASKRKEQSVFFVSILFWLNDLKKYDENFSLVLCKISVIFDAETPIFELGGVESI